MNHEQIEGVLGIKSTSPKNWIRGNVDRHPVVGVLPPGVCEGDTVVMRGRWEDRGWGLQFSFRECQSVRPKGVNGVKRYLAQNFKWIGPAIAEEIIRRFGEGFFDIVESDHRRLTEIRGITPQRADEIHAAWSEKKADKEAGLFFATCGISPAFQNRIQAAFSKMPIAQLIDTVKANPYQLVERVEGIGFVTADKIARRLDFDTASPFRIRAGIFHALHEAAENDGHCYLPAQGLVRAAADLLCVSPEMVAHELSVLLADEKVECFLKDRITLPRFLSAEKRVAARIKAIASQAVARVMASLPQEEWEWLTPKQREAVQCAIANNLMVLTGLPGTGKTSSLKAIVKAFGKLSIALCAPTGRAAKRMSQQIGRPAQTIHRLLQYHPEEGFRVNRDNPLDVDVVNLVESISAHEWSPLNGIARNILDFLALPSVRINVEPGMAKINRSRKKKNKPPLTDYHIVRWSEVSHQDESPGDTGIRHRVRYDVRGNWATFTRGQLAGRRIWRRPHQRGPVDAPFRLKGYQR